MGWNYDPDGIHAHQVGEINALTEKTTPVDDDLVIIEDSADSNAKKKVKLSNLGGGAESLDDLSDVDLSTPPSDGQVLKYDDDTSTWIPADDDTGSGSLPTASAKGDIAVYDGDSWEILAAGTNDHVLTADSAQTLGLKWAAAGGGGGGSTNHFLFKTYTLSPAPNSTYADNEDNADVSTGATPAYTSSQGYMLTNGDKGDSQLFTARFVGFNIGTGTVAVRVDAGSAVSGDLLRIWGMFGSDLIGRPSAVKVEHSDDDSSWTTVENRTGLTGSATGGRKFWRADFDISSAGSHRYWRVTCTGFSSWTFLSEIELWEL